MVMRIRDAVSSYKSVDKRCSRIRMITEIASVCPEFVIMQLKVTEANINEFGRFDKLKATVDRTTAKIFLEALEGNTIKPFQINMKVDQILRKFILEGGFDI